MLRKIKAHLPDKEYIRCTIRSSVLELGGRVLWDLKWKLLSQKKVYNSVKNIMSSRRAFNDGVPSLVFAFFSALPAGCVDMTNMKWIICACVSFRMVGGSLQLIGSFLNFQNQFNKAKKKMGVLKFFSVYLFSYDAILWQYVIMPFCELYYCHRILIV